MMNQLNDIPQVKHLKRSNSDPFGYFSKDMEKEKILFSKPSKHIFHHVMKFFLDIYLKNDKRKEMKLMLYWKNYKKKKKI